MGRKKLGVSQGRIAQIEAGIGTAQVSFDVLLNVLGELGYHVAAMQAFEETATLLQL